jgi:hypothetical protein
MKAVDQYSEEVLVINDGLILVEQHRNQNSEQGKDELATALSLQRQRQETPPDFSLLYARLLSQTRYSILVNMLAQNLCSVLVR